jgi:hypothetical protein
MATRRRKIRSFVLREQIPGIDGGPDLIEQRAVSHVLAEKARALRRTGMRTGQERAEDLRYRDLGLNVFDQAAGRAQLADLIQRGRDQTRQ